MPHEAFDLKPLVLLETILHGGFNGKDLLLSRLSRDRSHLGYENCKGYLPKRLQTNK